MVKKKKLSLVHWRLILNSDKTHTIKILLNIFVQTDAKITDTLFGT